MSVKPGITSFSLGYNDEHVGENPQFSTSKLKSFSNFLILAPLFTKGSRWVYIFDLAQLFFFNLDALPDTALPGI